MRENFKLLAQIDNNNKWKLINLYEYSAYISLLFPRGFSVAQQPILTENLIIAQKKKNASFYSREK